MRTGRVKYEARVVQRSMDSSVNSEVEEELSKKIHEACVKDLAGMLILNTIQESTSPMSAYDLIGLIHQKYGVLLNSGMVYPIIL